MNLPRKPSLHIYLQENVSVCIIGGQVNKSFLYVEVGLRWSVGSGGLWRRRPLLLVHCVLQTLHVTLSGLDSGCSSQPHWATGSQWDENPHPACFPGQSVLPWMSSQTGHGVRLFNLFHVGSASAPWISFLQRGGRDGARLRWGLKEGGEKAGKGLSVIGEWTWDRSYRSNEG